MKEAIINSYDDQVTNILTINGGKLTACNAGYSMRMHLQSSYRCVLSNSRLVIYAIHNIMADDGGNSSF